MRPLRPWLGALALGLACGCGTPPPMAKLALVTTRPDAVRPEILRRDVEARWCFSQNVLAVTLRPPWRARLADHGKAIGLAIDSVPEANVLTNVVVRVRIEQYLLFQRTCALVRGDAGRIP